MSRARNLILVTIDSLRVDHLGYAGYPVATSPILDRLSRESVVYSRALASGMPTYYSFPALHTGRHPLALGRGVLGLAPEEPTLASRLRSAGFTTAAFVASNPYLTRRLCFDRGFETFEDTFESSVRHTEAGWGAEGSSSSRPRLRELDAKVASIARRWRPLQRLHSEAYFQYAWRSRSRRSAPTIESQRKYSGAEDVVARALAWIRELPAEPFFLWVHLMDPHFPYFPPARALHQIGRSDLATPASAIRLNGLWNRDDVARRRLQRIRDSVVALYDASIRWADEQVGKLVACLEKEGHWEESLFVLTADHGEQFLEDGARYHAPTALTQSLLAVPLILQAPDLAPATVDTPTALIDLVPTVLEHLGLDVPADLNRRTSWPVRSDGNETRDPVVSEAVYGCENPWDRRQRRQRRLVAVQDRLHKVVVNLATGEEAYSRVSAWSGEERIASSDFPPSARRRLLEVALSHLARQRSASDRKRGLQARLRELGRELDRRAS